MKKIAYGYCGCGCGGKPKVSNQNESKRGYVAGKPRPYLPGHASRMRPHTPVIERFWKYVDIRGKDECWEWQAALTGGYGHLGGDNISYRAHRVSYEIYFGPIPKGKWCLHKCDNRKCVNPNHLFLGTPKENTADMIRKGRDRHAPLKGSDNPRSKLTEQDVINIKTLSKKGIGKSAIARMFPVSRRAIRNILDGKSWKHVS